MAEAETNLAINVIPGLSESYEVQGRGELQLGLFFLAFNRVSYSSYKKKNKVSYCSTANDAIQVSLHSEIHYRNFLFISAKCCITLSRTGILIENMRREGFELSVSPPRVM